MLERKVVGTMNEDNFENEDHLGDVAAIMRDRGPAGRAEQAGTFVGSTGDIVLRLRELGIYTHKARVGEVSDMLFGDNVRAREGAHRRISDEQFEILCRAFVLCAAYGYTMEELADFLAGRATGEQVRAHLERGLALLEALEEYAGLEAASHRPATAG